MYHSLFALLFTALLTSTSVAAQSESERLDTFIRRVMERGYSPGLAVAVVRGNELLLRAGYGVADEDGRPVDSDTRFYIASATKSLTGMAAARLAQEGRLELDASLKRHLPEVRAPEGLASERFTLEALLTHQHGLDNLPLVIRTAFSGLHDRSTLLDLVPESRVREEGGFAYSNVGYNLAGMALAEVAGTPDWRGAVSALVLEPLGMDQTTAWLSRVPLDQLALPFDDDLQGGLERMKMVKTDRNLHAAGGHFMSARDAATWLEANLNRGRVNGEQRLPAAVVDLAHEKRVDVDRDFGAYHRHGYALGWYHADYEGELLMHHFGGFAGFRSHISFMPEHGLGVAVFTNTSGAGFEVPDLIANYAYDLLRGIEGLDARYKQRLADLRRDVEEQWTKARQNRNKRAERVSHLSLPRAAYAGRYVSDLFGVIEVAARDGALHFEHGALASAAENFERSEAVRVELVPGSGMVVQFQLDDGEVSGLEFAGYTWTRQP